MDSEYRMVITTIDNVDDANQLVNQVVFKKLAACGHVSGPIASTYYWGGQLTTDQEWECVFKTTQSNFEKLSTFIKKHHSYEVPQIVVIPIICGNQEYLDWIENSVTAGDKKD